MFHLRLCLFLLIATASCFAEVPSSKAVDTVVVCAPDLVGASIQWVAYRREQGHRLALVSGKKTKQQIKEAIKSHARGGALKFVVLLGDAPPSNQVKRGTHVETDRVKSNVIAKWGAEPSYASDNYFADLDDDGSPDVALGRICADTPSELVSVLAKVMAYEQSSDVGAWRRKVNFVAGVGGFGVLADKILESAAKKFITDGIPASYQTSMTQASWRSPYSPDPRLFQSQTIERLNEGCLAWIYLGHGRKRELDYYRVPDGGVPIFSVREIPRVTSRSGSPIAVFLSCYAGAFDAEPDCLAEKLVVKPGGPVAVIAGSNVTMPYAMTVMGNAMLHELFDNQRETIGEVLLHAKHELAKPTDEKPKGLVDQLAKTLSPDPELLDEEREEHIRLFHLIGDPLMRIRYPKPINLDVAEYGTAGDFIDVRGQSDLNGPCVVELVCRRDRLTFRPQARPKFEFDANWLSGLQETYFRANNTVWVTTDAKILNGQLAVKLKVPDNARGSAHVRVFSGQRQGFAMGSADIYLRLPPPPEPAKTADGDSQ